MTPLPPDIPPDRVNDLDAWFPRAEAVAVPVATPDPGVIEGVKRPGPRRYARPWYTSINKKENGQ